MVDRMHADGGVGHERNIDYRMLHDDDAHVTHARSSACSDESEDGFGAELPPPGISIPGLFGCEPLADGWTCRFEEATGEPYYYQPGQVGRETTWDLPFAVDPRNKFSKEYHPNRVEGTYWTNGFTNQREAPEEEFIFVEPAEPTTPLFAHHRLSMDTYNSALVEREDGSDDESSTPEGCEVVEQEDGTLCYYKEGVMKPVGTKRGGKPKASATTSRPLEDLKDWALVENEDGSRQYYKNGEIRTMGKDGRLY